MNITVTFLSLPNVAKLVGGKTITIDFPGHNIRELVQAIVDRHGPQLRRFLLDESGELDPAIGVLLNKGERIGREQLDRPLKDGDRVTLMMLVGGG